MNLYIWINIVSFKVDPWKVLLIDRWGCFHISILSSHLRVSATAHEGLLASACAFSQACLFTAARRSFPKWRSEQVVLFQQAGGWGVETPRWWQPSPIEMKSPLLSLGHPALYFQTSANSLVFSSNMFFPPGQLELLEFPKSANPFVASSFHTYLPCCLACSLWTCSSFKKGLKCHFLPLNNFASPLPTKSGVPCLSHWPPYHVVL